MEIKVKPVQGDVNLSSTLIKMMEKTCPIWAWEKKQQLKRKNIKL